MEKWLPIPGFEGYEASDLGRIRSLPRKILVHGKSGDYWKPIEGGVLSQRPTWSGHLSVNIGNVGRKVHQLILLAFVGPRPTGQVSRHLNGNPVDNIPQNLCYGSQSQNRLDATTHGRHRLTSVDKELIRAESGISQRAIAKKYGICRTYVRVIRARA
jgi:hypothetical protein